MNRLLENAQLSTDMDAVNRNILNCQSVTGGTNVVHEDDTRLSDPRPVTLGSVTNDTVAHGAGITQDKVNFNSVMPPTWIGTRPDQAADGSLVQMASGLGVPNGYADLDSGGQLPSARVSATTTGTLKVFQILFPFELDMAPDTATIGSTTLSSAWISPPDGTFLGNVTGASGKPSFKRFAFYPAMIPNIAASKITSGMFPQSMLPPAIGTGVGHQTGLVPAPGTTGDPNDYLARDMTYKPMQKPVTYQPQAPDPSIVFLGSYRSQVVVTFSCPLLNVSIFYRLSDSVPFDPAPSGTIMVDPLTKVSAYAAKTGWNNSNIVSVTTPSVPVTGS